MGIQVTAPRGYRAVSAHLHFGMYYGKEDELSAFNPYPFLKAWEK